MQEILTSKLYDYIVLNNPDLLLTLQEEGRVGNYLSGKVATVEEMISRLRAEDTPAYIIEEQCLDLLTADLRPSRFQYLVTLLEEEFETAYQGWLTDGILTYEVINLLAVCDPAFDQIGFSEENEDSRQLRYELTGLVHQYLNRESE